MKKSRKTPFPTVIRLLVGVSVLIILVRNSDLRSLTIEWNLRTIAGTGLAAAIIAVAQIFSALRWRFLLGDDDALPFAYLVRVYLVGFFFGLFLPTSVGGDAVRAAAVAKGARRPGWVVSSVVLERAFGLAAMMALLVFGGVLVPQVLLTSLRQTAFDLNLTLPLVALAGAGALLFGGLAFWLIQKSARVKAVLRDGLALWLSWRERPRDFAAAFLTSFMVQGAYLLAWYQLAVALRLPVPAASFFVLVPFTSIAAMLPVTISGLGLREGAWVLLLAAYGVSSADAVAYSLLYFAAFVVVGLFGGLIFGYAGLDRPARKEVPAPAPLLHANSTAI